MEEILLGIDCGEKNTGLAFGRAGLVSPLKTVSSRNNDVTIDEISRAALENKATKLVVGLPLDIEGKETRQSREVRRFAKLLKARIKLPTVFVSEFSTSEEVVGKKIKSGISDKRETIDHFSAALILKRYYNDEQVE